MKQSAVMYQIHIREYLESHWADWLGGMTLTHTDQGQTILTGALVDQAVLYGVLTCLRDLGLTLISVRRCEADAVSGKRHDEEDYRS